MKSAPSGVLHNPMLQAGVTFGKFKVSEDHLFDEVIEEGHFDKEDFTTYKDKTKQFSK